MKYKYKKILKISFWIIGGLVLVFIATIPWRNYVYRKNIADGKGLLAERKYTQAYVKFQKAEAIEIKSADAETLEKLAKDSAGNLLAMRNFLADEKKTDLLALVDRANSKTCDLELDKTLIDKGLPEVAKINLEFCTTEGPKDYSSWLFLGLANLRLSESENIFKELKPGFRTQAADAFSKAYFVDPVNKTAIQYAIEVNKIIGNQGEVDRWQKLLDNLIRISQ